MRIGRVWWLSGLAVLALLSAACAQQPDATYTARGIIRAVDAAQRRVTIAHEAIPGYMDAMTMPFEVKEASVLEGLVPGEEVQFRLAVFRDRAYIDQLVLTKPLMADQQAEPVPPENAAQLHLPSVGESMPEARLINQDGQPVRLSEYRGKVLAMTFVYSRCPLPTYCPRAMQEFQLLKRLLGNRAGGEVQLLTVSFDPQVDTPAVLQRYGVSYGADGKAWQFLTGEPDQVERLVSFFNVAVWRRSNGAVDSHTMSAALIDQAGRIAQFYAGNRWTAQELLRDLRALLRAPSGGSR